MRPLNTGNNYHTAENPYMTEYSATLQPENKHSAYSDHDQGRQGGADGGNLSAGSPSRRQRLAIDTKPKASRAQNVRRVGLNQAENLLSTINFGEQIDNLTSDGQARQERWNDNIPK